MFAAGYNYVWVSICVATIFISLKAAATPVNTLLKSPPSEPGQGNDALAKFNIDEIMEIDSAPKTIVARSPDSDDNSVDGDGNEENKDNKTEKPGSEEIFPDDNKNHHHPHAHGSHGALGPVKGLINTVRDRFHGNDGKGGIHNILGAHHRPSSPDHISPIETERDRDQINSSTGLHVLEFLGTLFGLVWGFLSNIPALFGSSSAGLSGGQ